MLSPPTGVAFPATASSPPKAAGLAFPRFVMGELVFPPFVVRDRPSWPGDPTP
jgi:hypothetical protein